MGRPIPTTDHGILYPTGSGNTDIAVHIQNMADSVETALDTYETYNSWTLSWDTSGGGGFTSVGGSGFSEGFYQRIGKHVHAEFRVQLAGGFAVDTGTYVLVLPIAAYVFGGSNIQSSVGSWTAFDTSASDYWTGTLGVWSASGVSVSFGGSWDGTASRSRIDSNDPIVWASGDVLSGVLDYRGV